MINIPEEILLEIFSRLTLLGIIHARSVCKYWRETALLADIPPLRLEFYDLYLSCISSDAFQESRCWLVGKLVPFHRKAYIENLERQYPQIPDDFAFWIREWPSKAVLGGMWPGLPCERESGSRSGKRIPGVNELGCASPTVETIAGYELGDGTKGLIRGLKLWHMDGYQIWIVLDAPRGENRGIVFEFMEGVTRVNDGYIEGAHAVGNWTVWQKDQLERLNAWGMSAFHK